MAATLELTLHGLEDDQVWNLTIHVATLRMSLTTTKLVAEAIENPDPDPDIQVIKRYFYPAIVACTSCPDKPLPTWDEFMSLPAKEATAWYEAVQKLNPGTLPSMGGVPGEEPVEKKES